MLGDLAALEFLPPVTDAKFINKSSLFIQLLGVIRRLELKPIKEQKLRIYLTPHNIAKPRVSRGFISVSSFLQVLVSPFYIA